MTTLPIGLLLFVMIDMTPSGITILKVISVAPPFLGCDPNLLDLLITSPSTGL